MPRWLHREISFFLATGRKQTEIRIFTSEEEAFQKIAHELGLKKISKEGEPLKYCRHPLVYLVEAADDICYQMMDIEDAHKLKILTTQETKELYLHFFAPEKLDHIQSICKMVDDTNEQIAYLRSSAIGVLISECVHTFILHEEEILKGEFQGTLIQKLSSRVREAYENCSHTAFEKNLLLERCSRHRTGRLSGNHHAGRLND